jgi:hypothetical protein
MSESIYGSEHMPFPRVTGGAVAVRYSWLRDSRPWITVTVWACLAGAAVAQSVSSVSPSTITAGRSTEVTLTAPSTVAIPSDPKLLVATVGSRRAEVLRVRGKAVTILAPAYAQGTGERDLALFDTAGMELARAVIGYVAPGGNWTMWFVPLLLALVAMPLVMLWVDIAKAYQFASERWSAIIAHAAQDGLRLDEQQGLLMELRKAPPGIPGLARTMLAFMLILIVALTLFFVLTSGIDKVPDIVDKTITVLTTAVTTVIAFYFGARTATAATEAAAQPPAAGGPQSPPVPSPTTTPLTVRFLPARAPVGSDVTLVGVGFGMQPGEVRFGTVKATSVPHWSDGVIRVQVPTGLTPGEKLPIEVTLPGGTRPMSTAPALFEVV